MAAKTRVADLGSISGEDLDKANGEGSDIFVSGVDDADVKKIDAVLKANDISGGTIRLERRGPTDVVHQYICKIPVDQFDYENIKKVYGGGDYKAMTFRANGQIYRPFSFSIDHRYKGAMDESEIKQITAALNSKTNQSMDAGTMALSFLDRAKQNGNSDSTAMVGMLTKMMESQDKSSNQNMMMMMAMMSESSKMMMGCMSQVAAAIAGRQAPPSLDSAMVPIITQMLGNQKSTPISETISLMKELKGLNDGAPSESSQPETLVDKLIKHGLPAIASHFMGAGAPPVQQQVQIVDQPALVDASRISEPRQPTPQEESVKMLYMFMNKMLSAAKAGSDPTLYGDTIIEWMSDDQLDDLISNLTGDDWCDKLFAGDLNLKAQVVAYKPWFEEVRKHILTATQEDQPNEPTIDGGSIPVGSKPIPTTGKEDSTS